MIAMSNASRRHPLFVNEYFMRRAKSSMATVIKTALRIEHYWDRVEFVPGSGAIHHIVAIANDMAYLQDFFHAKTTEDKAAVVIKYAQEHLDMTADVDINDDKQRRPEYQNSPLGKNTANPQTKKRMYDSLQKIACVTYGINTACDWQKQTQMAQEHVEFILEQKQNTENKTHKVLHVQQGPKYLSTGKAFCISE